MREGKSPQLIMRQQYQHMARLQFLPDCIFPGHGIIAEDWGSDTKPRILHLASSRILHEEIYIQTQVGSKHRET